MKKLSELIQGEVDPEVKESRSPLIEALSSRLTCPSSAKLSRKYECDLFNFLFANKVTLGIQEVYLFKNLRIDGGVLLDDGRRFAVEVKLRMNWTKALQAGYEFERFLHMSKELKFPVKGAIVFFEAFQGDGWHRKPKKQFLENGWNYWYSTFCKQGLYPIHLLRFNNRFIENYHSELNASKDPVASETMTERERIIPKGHPEGRE